MADTIPAMLEQDEYVLNKNAVRVLGKENLDRINFEVAPREGYSHGGSTQRDLLSRTKGYEYTIPAGKNIFGQPTEEMGMEEMMEMIMPGGGAKATLQMGKGGIRAILSANKEDILKNLAKMRKTGEGSKKIAEAVDWQTELKKYLKEATSRRFTNPVKKQGGGPISAKSVKWKDEIVPSEYEGGPSLYKSSQIMSVPAEQVGSEGGPRYYLGEGTSRDMMIANEKAQNIARGIMRYSPADSIPAAMVEGYFGEPKAPKKKKKGRLRSLLGLRQGGSIDDYSLMDYMMPAMDKRLGTPLKKFQFGGYTTDYQGNVVGPQTTGSGGYTSQSQYQYGATPPASGTQPTGTGGLPTSPTGFGGGMTGTAQSTLGTALGIASAYTPPPSAQSQLAQPSGSMSTGIESIFQEAGLQTPGADYLETIAAYDPTKQQRLHQDYGRKLPGSVGGAGKFAKSGAAEREAGEQREMVTQQYQYGAEDLRKQYRENLLADIAQDIIDETYDFEDLA